LPRPKFVADAMLGSLARKLRIFGFDTAYFREGDDEELEALARREKRTILTSDRPLFERSRGDRLRAYLVEGRTDRARLLSIQRQAASSMAFRMGRETASRCALCNGELEPLRRRDAASLPVPPKVLARHHLFYRCKVCARLYWHGRHWERLRRLSYSLKTKGLTPGQAAGPRSRRRGP
jgi:uncharacterized protein with PIN domain